MAGYTTGTHPSSSSSPLLEQTSPRAHTPCTPHTLSFSFSPPPPPPRFLFFLFCLFLFCVQNRSNKATANMSGRLIFSRYMLILTSEIQEITDQCETCLDILTENNPQSFLRCLHDFSSFLKKCLLLLFSPESRVVLGYNVRG